MKIEGFISKLKVSEILLCLKPQNRWKKPDENSSVLTFVSPMMMAALCSMRHAAKTSSKWPAKRVRLRALTIPYLDFRIPNVCKEENAKLCNFVTENGNIIVKKKLQRNRFPNTVYDLYLEQRML